MTFSSLKEGLIYQDSGKEGYMAFYMHQPRRGLWGCFMLRYTHTKSIEGNRKISIKTSIRWKGKFTYSFFCSRSSHSCLHSMAMETMLWRRHHNRLWLQLGALCHKTMASHSTTSSTTCGQPLWLGLALGKCWSRRARQDAGPEVCGKADRQKRCVSAGNPEMSHYKSQLGAYQKVFFTEHLSIDKIKGFSSQLST